MSYVSLSYFIFIALIVSLYYVVPKKQQWILLLFSSMFFYCTISKNLIVFLFFTLLTSFLYTKYFRKSKVLLIATISINTVLLLILKIAASNTPFAMKTKLDAFAYLLPIGISFYTLIVIKYIIDVYQNKIDAESNFFKYVLVISFFPQIVQGPIIDYKDMKSQYFIAHKFDGEKLLLGLYYILWGLVLKLVLAERLNLIVSTIFDEYMRFKGFYFWIAAIFYSIQLYADFSGCMYIVSGTAKLFGIELPRNFNLPYFTRSIREFWNCWHITLSSFLKYNIYIPLGGSRKGDFRKYINTMITFLVSGIWHGIGTHYILWGGMHGMYLVLGDILKPAKKTLMKITNTKDDSISHRILQHVSTLFLVMIAWIAFRVSSVSQFFVMVKSMFTDFNPWILVNGELYSFQVNSNEWVLIIVLLIALFLVGILHKYFGSISEKFTKQPYYFQCFMLLFLIFFVLITGIYGPGYNVQQFIYGGF